MKTLQKLLLISMIVLTGCGNTSSSGNSSSEYSGEHVIYKNFREDCYYGNEGDSFIIDIEKDVFSDGILVTNEAKEIYKLRDLYDDFSIFTDSYEPLEFEKIDTFKAKITYPAKNTRLFLNLISRERKIIHGTFKIGCIYSIGKEVIEIDSFTDFDEIRKLDGQTLVLTGDLDFNEYQRIWEPPYLNKTNIINPNNYVIKNFSLQQENDSSKYSLFGDAHLSYFDNLIINDITIDTSMYEQDFMSISGLTHYSTECVFKNNLLSVLKVVDNGKTEYIGGLTFKSINCAFINNQVGVNIVQVGENEIETYMGGLSALDSRFHLPNDNIHSKETSYCLPIKYNRIKGTLQGINYVGGLFGSLETLVDDYMIETDNYISSHARLISSTNNAGEYYGKYTNWYKPGTF